ncbi:hypothetical protein F4809DRAFT_638344 [Biscogniauxia mediterranea]|nr:hypothetical protein F4809DRAFT_638344 [Biscogniauxia mediterranea]
MDNTTHEALLAAVNASSSLNSTNTLGLGVNIIELLLTLFGLKSLAPLFQHVNNGTEWSTTTTLAFLCLGWVSCKALSQGYQEVRRVFDRHFMSTVILIEKDFLYNSMLSWLAKHPNIIDSRNVLAENQMAETDGEETAQGSSTIRWLSQLLKAGMPDHPVKDLILQAREDYTSDSDSQTTVYKPDPIEMRNGRRSQFNWMKPFVLDKQQKKRVLDGMNNYLHPVTARWYADRGIPLRRGYIFFGPPGTGKTSLAYALAGQFGLDIFVTSLEDGTMTDTTLGLLVNSLPRRCVLLLEDIDADDDDMDNGGPLSLSGLLNAIDGPRQGAAAPGAASTSRSASATRPQKQTQELFSWMYYDDNYYHRPSNYDKDGGGGKPSDKNTTTTTTSSDAGTDGLETAPHEDDDTHLLSHPSFSFSSSPPSPSPSSHPSSSTCPVPVPGPVPVPSTSTSAPPPATAAAKSKPESESESKSDGINISSSSSASSQALDVAAVSELPGLAEQFAGKIPGGALTPAEIQGFLLQHKRRPGRAVREADAWVAAAVAVRKGGREGRRRGR